MHFTKFATCISSFSRRTDRVVVNLEILTLDPAVVTLDLTLNLDFLLELCIGR